MKITKELNQSKPLLRKTNGSRFVCVVLMLCVMNTVSLGQQAAPKNHTELAESAEYSKGIEAFADGDFYTAADLWLTDAYLGSANAQFNVGVLYVEGKGLPKDRGEAIFWFTKAARQGHLEAQYNLGHLLLEEQEDLSKIREGIDWWRKSAEGGFAIAQYNFGRALFYGIGLEQDRQGSKSWFERAAENDNTRAKEFLAENLSQFSAADNKPESQPKVSSETTVVGSNQKAPNQSADRPLDSEKLQTTDRGSDIEATDTEYVLVRDEPTLMYSRFNSQAPIVTRIGGKVLLRVVDRKQGWLNVAVPGGVPGWALTNKLKFNKDVAETNGQNITVYADPTANSENNDIGQLPDNTKSLVLEQQGTWTRLLLPESVTGWIESWTVEPINAESEKIAKVWQIQRVKLKVAAMAERKFEISQAGSKVANVEAAKSAPKTVSQSVAVQEQKTTPPPPATPVNTVVKASEIVAVQSKLPINKQTILATTKTADQKAVLPTAQEVDEKPKEPLKLLQQGKIIPEANEETAASSKVVEQQVVASQNSEQIQDDEAINQQQLEVVRQGIVTVANEADEPRIETRQKTNKDEVSVRIGPSNAFTAITQLDKGTLVDVVSSNQGYKEVTIPGGLPVWVENRNVSIRSDKVILNGEGQPARLEPNISEDSAIVGNIRGGTVVQLIEQRNGWLRVLGPVWITGWVSETSLDGIDDVSRPEALWRRQARKMLAGYGRKATSDQVVASGKIIKPSDEEIAKTPFAANRIATTNVVNDNNWLFERSSRKYTLQLFSMQNIDTARSLFTSLNSRGQLFSTVVKGQRWYFILMGKFLTPEAALEFARDLPSWASGVRVRSLARLQVNRCKKLALLNENERKGLRTLCGT